MKPLVSICLPNYNYEKFISETIDSVLAQTYENFELIIFDNASTDDSIKIIKSYNDHRIRVYQNETNISLYQNINNCIKEAKGELISVIHSDDKYEPDFLKEIVNAYIQNPKNKVFVTGVYLWHSDENYQNPWHPFPDGGIKSRQEVLIRLCKENNIGNGVNVVFSKDCFPDKIMFSDKYRYSADYELWFRLAANYDFVYIPKILSYYRIHSSNLSHIVNKNLDMIKESINIFRENSNNTSLFPLEIKTAIYNIQSRALIRKAFDIGIKYKSGKISRNMLDYIGTNIFDELPIEYYISYLLSYFISERFFKNKIKFVSFVGRLALYINNINIRYMLKKEIKKFRFDKEFCEI